MRKNRILPLFIAGSIAIASLAGCSKETNRPDTNPTEGHAVTDTTDGAHSGEKSLVYVFIKNRGDLSHWDGMAEGGDRARQDFADRAEVRVIETTDDLHANLTAMYEAADQSADLIITGNDFKDNLVEIAQEFPEIATVIIEENVVDQSPENIYGVDFSVSEAAFLGGIVAADIASQGLSGTSGNKTVGFIGGMDESAVIQEFLLGYFQGAKYYQPDTKLLYNYVGGWNDPDTARTQALAQYNDAGADVVFACAGGSGNGVHKAAAETGKYVIGVDSDQSQMYQEDKEIQSRFATSVLKKAGNVVYHVIEKYLGEGTLPFGNYDIYGLKEDSSDIVEDERFEQYVSENGKKALKEAREGIINGDIKIEGAIGKDQSEIKAMIDQYVKTNY
ncbi:MAG: BMP family ABC transporter substrate-binding protein [Hungatella sp.]|jgi:basic membrane protein A|nr:BMP family ABC transporter substrate-binding protein [Hungatella sp.]